MKDQLTHSDIERIIDEQERELDNLLQENLEDESERATVETEAPRPSLLKRCVESIRKSFMRLSKGRGRRNVVRHNNNVK